MPPKRPTSVTVLAVLQFIFGALGVCGALGTFALPALQQQLAKMDKKQEEIQRVLAQEAPSQNTVLTVQACVGLLLAGVLIASGAGLLNLRPWGRTLGLVYAVAALLNSLVGIIYSAVVLLPAYDKAATAVGDPSIRVQNILGLVFGSAFALILPITTLVILTRPSVRRAFAGLPSNEPAVEDYHDRRGPEDAGERFRPDDYDRPEGYSRPDDRYR